MKLGVAPPRAPRTGQAALPEPPQGSHWARPKSWQHAVAASELIMAGAHGWQKVKPLSLITSQPSRTGFMGMKDHDSLLVQTVAGGQVEVDTLSSFRVLSDELVTNKKGGHRG